MPTIDPSLVHVEVARYVQAGTRTVIEAPTAPTRIFGVFGKMEIKGEGVHAVLEGKKEGETPNVVARDPIPPVTDPEGAKTRRVVDIMPFRLDEGEKLRIVIEDPESELDRVLIHLTWFEEG